MIWRFGECLFDDEVAVGSVPVMVVFEITGECKRGVKGTAADTASSQGRRGPGGLESRTCLPFGKISRGKL